MNYSQLIEEKQLLFRSHLMNYYYIWEWLTAKGPMQTATFDGNQVNAGNTPNY